MFEFDPNSGSELLVVQESGAGWQLDFRRTWFYVFVITTIFLISFREYLSRHRPVIVPHIRYSLSRHFSPLFYHYFPVFISIYLSSSFSFTLPSFLFFLFHALPPPPQKNRSIPLLLEKGGTWLPTMGCCWRDVCVVQGTRREWWSALTPISMTGSSRLPGSSILWTDPMRVGAAFLQTIFDQHPLLFPPSKTTIYSVFFLLRLYGGQALGLGLPTVQARRHISFLFGL